MKRAEVRAVVALLALALALSLWAAVADVPGWERNVVRDVQSWSLPGERLSDAVRSVTGTTAVLMTGAVVAGLLWLSGARREAVTLALVLVALAFAQPFIKDAVDRPRPAAPVADVRGSVTSESFPAGHVMSPTVLYGFVLWMSADGRLRLRLSSLSGLAVSGVVRVLRPLIDAWCVAVLALTGIANVWLGVHWPTDVLGGYAWGAALAAAGVLALREWERR
jgi:undecaprenyl-diphosphatase